jgi:hypothetical protein
MRNYKKLFIMKHEGRRQLRGLFVVLKLILEDNMEILIGLSWFRTWFIGSSCENGRELLGFIDMSS